MTDEPLRLAVVPPVPVPYREPLFAGLAARDALRLRVIYQAATVPGWDQPGDWFPDRHPYDAVALRARQRPRPGRTPIIWPRGLERALSDFDPGCVVVSEYGPASLRALRWCRRRGRPLVVLTECTPELDRVLSGPQRALHRWVARRAAGFVAVSGAARRRLLGMGVPPDAVEVSLQSADLEPIRAAAPGPREPSSGGSRPVRVLAVGRLVPDKNVERLLEAFAAARLGPDEAELEVCGTGPLAGDLHARAERLGVPATFPGYVPPGELAERYAAADAFVLVSTFEPFGVAAREAVASGLPLVCSRAVGAAGDVAVEGRNALLVDPASTEEIAGALGRLCRDQALRAELSRASWEMARGWGTDADVAAFERAVLRAAGRRPPVEREAAVSG